MVKLLNLRLFKTQLVALFGLLILIWLSVVVTYFVEEHAREVAHNRGETLHATAIAAAQLLSTEIEERYTEIEIMAHAMVLLDSTLTNSRIGEAIQLRKNAHREYLWIGIADLNGHVIQASDGILVGESVTARPWFKRGLAGPYAGDIHEAVLLAKHLPQEKPNQPLRFIDFASPVADRNGVVTGVLAAHASWDWVTDVVAKKIAAPHAEDKIELLVLNSQGDVLYPFELVGTTRAPALRSPSEHYEIAQWADEGEFLSSQVPVQSAVQLKLDWHVVARQPASIAQAAVTSLRLKLMTVAGFSGLVFLLLAYLVAKRTSRPIEALADAARRISRRESNVDLPDPKSARSLELSQLYDSFGSMTRSLLQREKQLEALNASLESQVAARTLELTAANEKLTALAIKDPLTGLSNRRHFDERLLLAFQQMNRSALPYHVMMIDADHFKRVNDTFGHDVGDQVLKKIAQILASSVRETDVVARYGGEEFVVLLSDADPQYHAKRIAEKLRQQIESSTFPQVNSITVSIGLSTATSDDPLPESALRRADEALYKAKKEGRNRVQVS